MANANDVALRFADRDLKQWLALQLRRDMESLAPSFAVQLWDAWAGQNTPFVEGDTVQILWKNGREFTGYIDAIRSQSSATNTLITVTGRSKTLDLIECSAVTKPGEWRRTGLLAIATDIAAPFGIACGSDVDLGAPFAVFTLQEGESANEAIQRLARMRGVLAVGDEFGDVQFTRAGTERAGTKLQYRVNILESSSEISAEQRYSEYTIKTQVAGTDDFFGANAAAVSAKATDPDVRRYRPLTLIAEAQETGASLQKRADWERTYRAGQSRRAAVKTYGAEHRDGYLWAPNMLVDIDDPRVRLKGELLIVATTLSIAENGTTTDLELANPAALTIEPLAPPKKKRGGFDSWL